MLSQYALMHTVCLQDVKSYKTVHAAADVQAVLHTNV